MNPESQRALLTLALFAAFADGHKADSEREAIRNLADSPTTRAGTPWPACTRMCCSSA